MPKINPEILKWARETAKLSLEDAAKGIIGNIRGKTGAQRLEEYEEGIVEPSRELLYKISKKYKRPLLTFYLDKAPKPSNRGQDLRTLSQNDEGLFDPNFEVLLRNVKASQEITRGLLEDEEALPLEFINSIKIDQRPEDVAQNIIETIDFDIQKFRSYRKIEEAFQYLRDKIEDIGIFVILIQDLGSHHSKIPLNVFRGFVISDDLAPFIVINDADAVSAKSFTLLHELTHLWLGTTGISDTHILSNHPIEQFCNQVASLILLTKQEVEKLKEDILDTNFSDLIQIVSDFAKDRNISRRMVSYRLFLQDGITLDVWEKMSEKFYEDWQELLKKQKDKNRNNPSGPSYYIVRRNKLGRELTILVRQAVSSGVLTPVKASIVLLGVSPHNIYRLVSEIKTKGNS